MTQTRYDLEAEIGPRSVTQITTQNRVAARKWLGTFGVPYAGVAGILGLKELTRCYQDLSDVWPNRYANCTDGKVYLNFPYSKNEEAKAAGARWDKDVNKWYMIEGFEDDGTFARIQSDAPDSTETPTQTPEPAPVTETPSPSGIAPQTPTDRPTPPAKTKAERIAEILGEDTAGITEDRVIELVREHAPKPDHVVVTVETTTPREPKTLPDAPRHEMFPDILSAVAADLQIAIVGPAGSGKTTMAEQIAEALGLDFYFSGAIASEYKLSGFMDAQSRLVRTQFREAYEHGGLFLFDEVDGSLPGAIMSFNASLANGHADFPDGMVKRHPDFRVIAAANTFGTGADRIYVGRNQLDGATLDRFIFREMGYDEKLERAMTGDRDKFGWCDRVQAVRRAASALKLRHIVSPRSTMMGLKLLEIGTWTRTNIESATIFKSLDSATIRKIEEAI